MPGVRIDKWLWVARFFKTRNLAARACDLGRIQSNKQPAKPAREVHVGDLLQIKTEAGDFEVRRSRHPARWSDRRRQSRVRSYSKGQPHRTCAHVGRTRHAEAREELNRGGTPELVQNPYMKTILHAALFAIGLRAAERLAAQSHRQNAAWLTGGAIEVTTK